MTRWFAPVWGVVCTLVYSVLALLRWRNIEVTSWDNAIFEQAVAAYSRFEAPIVTVKGSGYNILGDHFSPIYALLAPVYRVFPYAQTLLLAQTILIGISVVIVARTATKHLPLPAGIVVAVCYGLSFGLAEAVAVDFHEVAFAVPFLALAGEAFIEGRFTHVVWWSLPLLLVKEDLGVTVAAIGVALWLSGQRRLGLVLAIGGAAATALIVTVLIPFFNSAGGYDYTGELGGGRGIIATLFADGDTKLLTLAVTFGVTGCAALLSPWAVVALPTLLWRFIGDRESFWGTEWHYSLGLMPIVFIAMIDTEVQQRWTRWPTSVVATVVTAATVFSGPLAQLFDVSTWSEPAHVDAAHRAMAVIPNDAWVESDLGLLTHLVSDHRVYWRGTVGDAVPDFIVFDRHYSEEHPGAYGMRVHHAAYNEVFSEGRYVVVERRGIRQ